MCCTNQPAEYDRIVRANKNKFAVECYKVVVKKGRHFYGPTQQSYRYAKGWNRSNSFVNQPSNPGFSDVTLGMHVHMTLASARLQANRHNNRIIVKCKALANELLAARKESYSKRQVAVFKNIFIESFEPVS